MAINTQKVVVAGLGAGAVLAVLDLLVNGVLLRNVHAVALDLLNPELRENAESSSAMAAFAVIDLLFGVLLVWTYAAMRPRFGAGPRTAVLAALQVWLVATLLVISMALMGVWPWSYAMVSGALFLVILFISSLVGGRLYAEE